MEERKLNEKESLELIAQMIQNTKNRMETNCGMPFLLWGYTTVFTSLLVWLLVTYTQNNNWQYLWFMLPIIGGTGTYLSARNQQPTVKSHLDKVISYIWLVFGTAGFLISLLAMFFWKLPILFIILLLMGMGTTLTGLVINYKTVTICGTLGALSSIGCLFYEGFNQVLIFAPVFIFMMIIPGHVLNHAARKQIKLYLCAIVQRIKSIATLRASTCHHFDTGFGGRSRIQLSETTDRSNGRKSECTDRQAEQGRIRGSH